MGKLVRISILCSLMLLCCGFAASAAGPRYDTDYYERMPGTWHLRLRSEFNDTGLAMLMPGEGGYENGGMKLTMVRTGVRYKQCVGAGWNWLFLNVGFRPFVKNADLELNLNVYGNRFGFNLTGGLLESMRGGTVSTLDEVGQQILSDQMITLYGNFNAYYALNWKHFSMPAAVAQNFVQKKSAGSLLLTAASRTYLFSPPDKLGNISFKNFMGTYALGPGLGYAYNWVPFENFMVHASLVANYGLLNRTTLWMNTSKIVPARSDLVFMSIGRLSVIYRLKAFYFGIVGNTDVTFAVANKAEKEDEAFLYSFLKNDAHLTIGVRF